MTFVIASSPAPPDFQTGPGDVAAFVRYTGFEEEEKGVKVSSSLVPANLTVFAPG